MTTALVYPLAELGRDHAAVVGTKGANLGELRRLGVRVPPGYAISVVGYERFMRETGAGDWIRAYLAEQGDDLLLDVERQRAARRHIRRYLRQLTVPAPLAQAIVEPYRALGARLGVAEPAVAVRSSGRLSMPGQMESHLNVRGERELLRMVVEVWSSTYTARAIAYRARRDLGVWSPPIGVVVLRQVDAVAAGVVLTALPATGDPSFCVVEGTWGLGEGLVSGELTPDHFVVDKQRGEVQSTVADKPLMVVCRDQGTAVVEVPAADRARPCLAPGQLAEVVEVALRVEAHFGEPQDAEWVLGRGEGGALELSWVQTRPVRRAGGKPADSEYLAELMSRVFQT